MLVDQGGTLAVVSHPRHQVLKPRPAGCREMVTSVPQVVEVQALHADRLGRMWPAGHLVEVAAPQRATHLARKDQRGRLIGDEAARCSRSTGMIAAGIPTMRRPALDLGGPNTISPVERST